jgi:hypothetical protein
MAGLGGAGGAAPLNSYRWRSVAVVAAHPDDDVLGVGGLMTMLADRGERLQLIAVTDGEASHPDPEIAERRVAESAAALKHIGLRTDVIAGVVVPAHNEQEHLPACLATLRGAEVIVVADACTDRTAEEARQGGATVIEIGARNVGVARAVGVRELAELNRGSRNREITGDDHRRTRPDVASRVKGFPGRVDVRHANRCTRRRVELRPPEGRGPAAR